MYILFLYICISPLARLIPLLLDITSSEAITSAVSTVTSPLHTHDGILMGIINNAGYMEKGVVEMLAIEKWRKQFEGKIGRNMVLCDGMGWDGSKFGIVCV